MDVECNVALPNPLLQKMRVLNKFLEGSDAQAIVRSAEFASLAEKLQEIAKLFKRMKLRKNSEARGDGMAGRGNDNDIFQGQGRETLAEHVEKPATEYARIEKEFDEKRKMHNPDKCLLIQLLLVGGTTGRPSTIWQRAILSPKNTMSSSKEGIVAGFELRPWLVVYLGYLLAATIEGQVMEDMATFAVLDSTAKAWRNFDL